MASRINFVGLGFLVILATSAFGNTSAATYVVGDSTGWTIPNGGASFYANYASQHTFRVGDVLVFNFPTGSHDLAIVSKQNYDGCSSSNPISLVTVGPAKVNLTSAGEAYFICTFNGHCSLGQKLAINVSSPAAATPPTPTPVPAPPITPTPAPAATPPKPSPATPAPAPALPAPAPAPTTPAPAPGGPAPTPSTAPSPAPGGSSPVLAPAPGPGGSPPVAPAPGPGGSPPADTTPPPSPSAAPASTTATSTIMVMLVSFSIGFCLLDH